MAKKNDLKNSMSAGLTGGGGRQPDPIHGRAKRGSKAEEGENRAL